MENWEEESEDPSSSLASKLAGDAPGFRGTEIHTLWLPFLRAFAAKQFEAFKLDHLRLLLGAEYFPIMHMERILGTQQPASQHRQPLAETGRSSVVRLPVVGEKRKLQADAEVIDLTGD
ncbi:hypothetical protein ACJZ2D_009328 [Fusarium nematophilum]